MNLERRLQCDLRTAIDWLVGRGYSLSRESGALTLDRGARRIALIGGRLTVVLSGEVL